LTIFVKNKKKKRGNLFIISLYYIELSKHFYNTWSILNFHLKKKKRNSKHLSVKNISQPAQHFRNLFLASVPRFSQQPFSTVNNHSLPATQRRWIASALSHTHIPLSLLEAEQPPFLGFQILRRRPPSPYAAEPSQAADERQHPQPPHASFCKFDFSDFSHSL
jgi:hypothetical protein